MSYPTLFCILFLFLFLSPVLVLFSSCQYRPGRQEVTTKGSPLPLLARPASSLINQLHRRESSGLPSSPSLAEHPSPLLSLRSASSSFLRRLSCWTSRRHLDLALWLGASVLTSIDRVQVKERQRLQKGTSPTPSCPVLFLRRTVPGPSV